LKKFTVVEENRKKRDENGEAVDLMNRRVMAGLLVQSGQYSIHDLVLHLNDKFEKKTQAAEEGALAKRIKENHKDTVTFEKALEIRDMKEESEWTSDQYKFMIQFKRLRVLQDHVRTLKLTNQMAEVRRRKTCSRLG
jgi:hypothetical protein